MLSPSLKDHINTSATIGFQMSIKTSQIASALFAATILL